MLKLFSSLLFMTACFVAVAAGQTVVEGAIRDTAGKAVADASVSLHRTEGSISQRTKSDIQGKFHFPAAEAGAYTLNAEALGFFPSSYDFVLRARQPISLTIELQPPRGA
jgi:Carboxypeptidase regulatory-like domain